MKYITPILILALSVGVFLWYIQPTYNITKDLKVELVKAQEDLEVAKQAQIKLDSLATQAKNFTPEDLARLDKLMPDQVDTIQQTVDLSVIAKKYGSDLINIRSTILTDASSGQVADYGTVQTSFNVKMTYEKFQLFLRDIETTLQLSDVSSITFTPSDTTNDYSYGLTLKTYWLK